MRIRIACGLYSRSWAGFWKNDRTVVHALRAIQYNNLLSYFLFIILYNIYNLLFIRLAVITHNWTVIRHTVTIIFIFTIVLPQNVIFGSVQSIAYATLLGRPDDNALRDGFPCSRHPPREFWRRLKERGGLEPRTNIFFRLRNQQKLLRIRFGCGLDWRINGNLLCQVARRNKETLLQHRKACCNYIDAHDEPSGSLFVCSLATTHVAVL